MWFRVLLNQRSINGAAISFAHESALGLANANYIIYIFTGSWAVPLRQVDDPHQWVWFTMGSAQEDGPPLPLDHELHWLQDIEQTPNVSPLLSKGQVVISM